MSYYPHNEYVTLNGHTMLKSEIIDIGPVRCGAIRESDTNCTLTIYTKHGPDITYDKSSRAMLDGWREIIVLTLIGKGEIESI